MADLDGAEESEQGPEMVERVAAIDIAKVSVSTYLGSTAPALLGSTGVPS
ncbi:hypothetical protein [Streptomyces sp. NPDC057910]